MTLVDLIQLLQRLIRENGKRLFLLREIAALSGASRASAGMALLRARKKGIVFRVGNLWINRLDPPELSEIAFALRSPSYLSFESALYRQGVLSQSPRGALTMATSGRSGQFETPWGTIRFVHLKRDLFFGYDAQRLAYPEKAWLDLIYIRGRSGRSQIITETVYLERLNRKRLKEFGRRFPSKIIDRNFAIDRPARFPPVCRRR